MRACLRDTLHVIRGYSCVYSLTESEIPYVTHAITKNMEVDSNIVLIGGMSGVGAKGALTYGLIASNLLLTKTDSSVMYQKSLQDLSSQRLFHDLINLQ